MTVRPLNREQAFLLPPTLDELIPDDHPARFVATLVDALDRGIWEKLGIELEGESLGAPSYHPRALLSVWLYSFMTGMRSSRKLETACRDQMPYLWLTGWQHPDHNTLWCFYKAHREQMRHLFKISVRTAVKMGLVDLAKQAVDGTKIVANASKHRTYNGKGLDRLLKHTDEVIRELEKENEDGSDQVPVHLPEKLRKAKQLQREVKAAIKQLGEEDRYEVNLTDGDARLMKSRQGIVAGYNVEAVVSTLKPEEAGRKGLFLTAVDAVNDPDDHGQLIPMLDQAEENTGKKADISLADAGFHSGANLALCDERRQKVAMPEAQEKAFKQPYHKDRFIYDADSDSYQCPCGQKLRFIWLKAYGNRKLRIYRGSGAVCRKCIAFGQCTRNYRQGRELQVGEYEVVLRRHREWRTTEEAQELYRRRKEMIEPAFGIIKEQIGIRRFFSRGWGSVRAEAATLAVAFNLRTLYSMWQVWSDEKRGELVSVLKEAGQSVTLKSVVSLKTTIVNTILPVFRRCYFILQRT